MKRIALLSLVFFLLFFSSVVKIAKAIDISECSELNQTGETYLTSDIINSGNNTCILISADNVTLDCQGHTIDGIGSGYTVGIASEGNNNITIKNCTVTDWFGPFYITGSRNSVFENNFVVNVSSPTSGGYILFSDVNDSVIKDNMILYYPMEVDFCFNDTFESNSISNITAFAYSFLSLFSNNNTLYNITTSDNPYHGIYFYSSSNNTLTNITANDNGNSGIYLTGSSFNNTLTNITARDSSTGIEIDYSNNNILTNIILRDNGYGIVFYVSSNNTLTNAIIENSNTYGIYLWSSYGDSANNSIYNNLLNNTINVYIDVPVKNYWNTTYQEGINIWSSSLGYIGGNLYTNSTGNDFSDTCADANYDGFCDSPYTLAENNTDYLPLSSQYEAPVPSCTTPYENMEISEDTTLCGGAYYLNDTDTNGAIKVTGSNLVLDCNNTVLIGNDTETDSTYGFAFQGTNITLKNCEAQGYNKCFGVEGGWGAENVTIENSIAHNCNWGFFDNWGNGLNLTNDTASGFGDGIYVSNSADGSISNSNISSLGYGVHLENASRITVTNNKINGGGGVISNVSSNSITIDSNNISASQGNSLGFYHGSSNFTVHNNTLSSYWGIDFGVNVSDINITNNTMTDSYQHSSFGYAGYIRNILAYDNILSESEVGAYAIYCYDGGCPTFENVMRLDSDSDTPYISLTLNYSEINFDITLGENDTKTGGMNVSSNMIGANITITGEDFTSPSNDTFSISDLHLSNQRDVIQTDCFDADWNTLNCSEVSYPNPKKEYEITPNGTYVDLLKYLDSPILNIWRLYVDWAVGGNYTTVATLTVSNI